MQQDPPRRSNRERSQSTREKLIAAARRLFIDKTYAETGTPEIVAAAGLTRGALYHHFADKQALFQAVVEREAQAVAAEIERRADTLHDPLEALIEGGNAFLAAMAAPGRTRLLLLDGPAVLGRAAMDEIDNRHGNRTLREGLAAAIETGTIRPLPLEPLTVLLAAVYDRAALAQETGADPQDYRRTIAGMIESLGAAAGLSRRAPRPARR
ncbi:TetR/AcrR family transcriptional regulator [Chelativorans sp. M5D2P16]|uniref:TetR/AcrR family transcriptional regulator n=1 Tax=Chelativorans sp. M5D2P16 TaxID=3095678 RepID=UPI002ACA4941|nr:TetR/AcrR family transcriptional regulator [Chelativorans sp. M5D2P16]MDZ5698092.1 TetR/AcrR family transcriptional regulator [Chelativorans sp. M5D2P16]